MRKLPYHPYDEEDYAIMQKIVDDKEHELGAARSSWSDLTDNDIRDIHEFIIDPNYKRFVTKDFRSIVSKSDINSNSNIE